MKPTVEELKPLNEKKKKKNERTRGEWILIENMGIQLKTIDAITGTKT